MSALRDIPLAAVKVKTTGPGEAVVIHVESGIQLGRVERDGGRGRGEVEWFSYQGESRVGAVATDQTRAWAVDSLLDPHSHRPPKATVDERLVGRRDLTEEESRRAFPEAWAWWDRVRPLFQVEG